MSLPLGEIYFKSSEFSTISHHLHQCCDFDRGELSSDNHKTDEDKIVENSELLKNISAEGKFIKIYGYGDRKSTCEIIFVAIKWSGGGAVSCQAQCSLTILLGPGEGQQNKTFVKK